MIHTRYNAFKFTRGFTLVEILIATTLFSLVLTMIFSALYTGSRSWHAGEVQVETNDQYRIGLGFIRKYLSQATPISQIDGRERRLLFKGESHELHFISELPAYSGGSSHHLLSLVVEEKDDVASLMLFYQPMRPDIEINANLLESDVESIALLSDIDGFEISYFGREQLDTGPDWFDRWDNDELMPEMISILLTTTNQKQLIPELLIPLHVTNVRGMNQFVMNKDNTDQQPSSRTDDDREI
jgi:general secretion pathway protein J